MCCRAICPRLDRSSSAPRMRGASAFSSPPISRMSRSGRPTAPRLSFLPSRRLPTSMKRRCALSFRSAATFSSAARISWPGTLTCWRRHSPPTGTRFPLPPSRRTAPCPRIAAPTPSSPAKACRMIEGGRTASTFRGAASWKLPRHAGRAFVFLAAFLSLFGPRSPSAHEVIDGEQVRAALAAVEAADVRAKNAAGSATEGEAKLALGLVQVETTEILNRDLAAHSGRLSFNGDSLQKSLAQRSLSPPFDDTIGRYRLPRATLEDALRLSPAAPAAPRARFALLKAGFYESFVFDPFKLVGFSADDLARQIAEAQALAAAALSADDAEEAAFIYAIDLARGARLAREPEAARAYAAKARKALATFAEAYPESMRAASAVVILKGLGGAE